MSPTSTASADARTEGAGQQKTCFVISPIGDEGSSTRMRSDKVLKHVIRKALEPRYRVERADELNLPGTISVQVVERVFEADLVVADLSEQNPNVFYELAIRHATKKPSVHIVSSGEKLPFDINQIRAVQFNIADPDSIEEAQARLREQVEAIEAGEGVVTPVQIAQSLTSLRTGEDRDKQILEVLQGLAGGVSTIREDLFSAANQIVSALWDYTKPRTLLGGAANLSQMAGGAFNFLTGLPPKVAPEARPTPQLTSQVESSSEAKVTGQAAVRRHVMPGRHVRRSASPPVEADKK